jgi:hypothetical protein
MRLSVGEVYRFYKDVNDFLDLLITQDSTDCYWAKVLDKGSQNLGTPIGDIGRLSKRGKLLEDYDVSHMPDYVVEETVESDDTPVKKKRRNPSEIEIDKLIDHVQRNFQLDQLYKQIDAALENDDVGLFIRLSKEYANLKKKVKV